MYGYNQFAPLEPNFFEVASEASISGLALRPNGRYVFFANDDSGMFWTVSTDAAGRPVVACFDSSEHVSPPPVEYATKADIEEVRRLYEQVLSAVTAPTPTEHPGSAQQAGQ